MKLGIIITQNDPETVLNVLKLARYSLHQGDTVRFFLTGPGVNIEKITDARYNASALAREIATAGGKFQACGTCLKVHFSGGSELCEPATMKEQHEIIRDSDKVLFV